MLIPTLTRGVTLSIDEREQAFLDLLDANYNWPAEYMFKFIANPTNIRQLEDVFKGETIEQKPSRTRKYISVTIRVTAHSSKEVMDYYHQVKVIDGIISL